MATTIQLRRDTTNNWNVNMPVLGMGELGYDTDLKKLKMGDGVTGWSNLPYLVGAIWDYLGTTAPYSRKALVWEPKGGFWDWQTAAGVGVYDVPVGGTVDTTASYPPWSVLSDLTLDPTIEVGDPANYSGPVYLKSGHSLITGVDANPANYYGFEANMYRNYSYRSSSFNTLNFITGLPNVSYTTTEGVPLAVWTNPSGKEGIFSRVRIFSHNSTAVTGAVYPGTSTITVGNLPASGVISYLTSNRRKIICVFLQNSLTMFRSADGGATWSSVVLPGASRNIHLGVELIGRTKSGSLSETDYPTWVVRDSISGEMLGTEDGGLTWLVMAGLTPIVGVAIDSMVLSEGEIILGSSSTTDIYVYHGVWKGGSPYQETISAAFPSKIRKNGLLTVISNGKPCLVVLPQDLASTVLYSYVVLNSSTDNIYTAAPPDYISGLVNVLRDELLTGVPATHQIISMVNLEGGAIMLLASTPTFTAATQSFHTIHSLGSAPPALATPTGVYTKTWEYVGSENNGSFLCIPSTTGGQFAIATGASQVSLKEIFAPAVTQEQSNLGTVIYRRIK